MNGLMQLINRLLLLISCGTNLVVGSLWHESCCWLAAARISLASQPTSQPSSNQPARKSISWLLLHWLMQDGRFWYLGQHNASRVPQQIDVEWDNSIQTVESWTSKFHSATEHKTTTHDKTLTTECSDWSTYFFSWQLAYSLALALVFGLALGSAFVHVTHAMQTITPNKLGAGRL